MILKYLATVTLVLLMHACAVQKKPSDAVRPGSSMILAELDGVSSADRARKGARYTLICNDAQGTVVSAEATQISPSNLGFPGESIRDGYECALEMRATIEPEEEKKLKWYSRPPEVGLLYSSNKKTLSDRSLDLTLYKIYGENKDAKPSADDQINGYDLRTTCTKQDTTSKLCSAVKLGMNDVPWFAEVSYRFTTPNAATTTNGVVLLSSAQALTKDPSGGDHDLAKVIEGSFSGQTLNKRYGLVDMTKVDTLLRSEPRAIPQIKAYSSPTGYESASFLNFRQVHSFGVSEVARKELGPTAETVWFALIRAERDQKTASFVITDVNDDFLPKPGKSAMDLGFNTEATDGSASARELNKKLRVLAFKGTVLAAEGCTLRQKEFVETLHARRRDEALALDFRQKLWACEIKDWPKQYDEWDQNITVFRWGWHTTRF